MNDSSQGDQFASIQLSEQESQALDTLLTSLRARCQFQEQARELYLVRKMRKDTASTRKVTKAEFYAQRWLDIVESAEVAGELAPAFRFLMRVFAVEFVHEQRWMDGLYDEDVAGVSAQIDAICQQEGLDEGETWKFGRGPADWEVLNNRYDEILDKKFEEALREYGLNDIADLYRDNSETFDACREEGRCFVFSDKSELEKLSAICLQFEAEANTCAKSKAYHAAAVMIGSAMEAGLLFACLNYRDDALIAHSLIPEKQRPKSKNPRDWTCHQLAMVADEAGWLPNHIVGDGTLSFRGLTDTVRRVRNMVHPARHLSNKIPLDIEGQYVNAQATYVLLKRHLLAADPGYVQGGLVDGSVSAT